VGRESTIDSGGPVLSAYVSAPEGAVSRHGLVLCHGFPSRQRPGAPSRSYHQLADRVTEQLGWAVLAVSLRGCGESAGDFSLGGWVEDVNRAVGHIRELGTEKVWVAGSTTGGSLAILAAAGNPEISGVAAIAARADFDDWDREPDQLLAHARRVAVIKDPDFPADLEAWRSELGRNRPIDRVAELADRPLLILHGSADLQVPPTDARRLAEAHGSAELRIISGGDHRLRHDPRTVALLLGWLGRREEDPDQFVPRCL